MNDDEMVANRLVNGRNVVQAGTVHGGVHFHASAESAGTEAGLPPILASASVSALDRLDRAVLIVDGDPPSLMALSGTVKVVVTVEVRLGRAVVLDTLRPVVLERRPPRLASVCRARTTVNEMFEPRWLEADLEVPRPEVATPASRESRIRRLLFELSGDGAYPPADPGDFPYIVNMSTPQQFRVVPSTASLEVAWQLELDWTCAGQSGTYVIDDHGKAFQLYPEHAGIHEWNPFAEPPRRTRFGFRRRRDESDQIEDMWERFRRDPEGARSWYRDVLGEEYPPHEVRSRERGGLNG
jgi:hypothetical protein